MATKILDKAPNPAEPESGFFSGKKWMVKHYFHDPSFSFFTSNLSPALYSKSERFGKELRERSTGRLGALEIGNPQFLHKTGNGHAEDV
ncbi:hypothetical protein P4C99_12960 [Pontiellaceae bacterium B1224]|nr:hypothetical protein [Pontiellaceae bacterium B1224]